MSVPEYTVASGLGAVAVVLLELFVLRTGIFRTAKYWLSMLIVYAFMIPTDGWLTKLSAPVVIYDPHEMTGWRLPWDIPVEDFVFGFALVTLSIVLWEWLGRRNAGKHGGEHHPAADAAKENA